MEKIWLKSYQQGVNAEVDMSRYQSIADVFDASVKKFANRPAYHNMGKTLTYQQASEQVDHFASFLRHKLKLAKGERVAVMMPNVLQYPIAVFGILKAELVVVNVNPLYTPRELEHQLKDSGATTIIVLENFANTLEQVLSRTPVKNVIVASIGDLLGFKGVIANFVVRHIKKMVPNYRIPHLIKFNDTLSQGKSLPKVVPSLTHDDIAFLQYTGGTTGVAKGAVLTHGNIVANMLQVSEWIGRDIRDGEEVVITALPLYHIFSLTANLMTFTMFGGVNVLITNPRDMPGFVKELRQHKVTILTGVNTLFNGLLNNPDFASVDFSSWRFALGGGMAVQRAVAEKWVKVTGIPLVEAYGLTETSPAACINPLGSGNKIGYIGLPIPSTVVSIRDNEGKEVGIGEAGELWIQGPQVMREYWNRPEDTAQSLDAQHFLATGDIACIDAEGFVKLVDRKKDMIVVSGFNVYPNEVEDVVAAHPDVLEVACIGVAHPRSGEALKLFIVSKNPALKAEEIIAFCRENLTAYKVPKLIEFRDELPKTNVGKILRRALRDEEDAKQPQA
ncbi:MAG: AMP-binding protein [Neisseriaceae bacterium]|nr:AMP-binding protein [Neisseriaceae bacterium]